jgi:hypothetical protein
MAVTTSRRKHASTSCSPGLPRLRAEGIDAADTWDADYARLLERAQKRLGNRNVERLASLVPASWNHIVQWLGLLEDLRRAS